MHVLVCIDAHTEHLPAFNTPVLRVAAGDEAQCKELRRVAAAPAAGKKFGVEAASIKCTGGTVTLCESSGALPKSWFLPHVLCMAHRGLGHHWRSTPPRTADPLDHDDAQSPAGRWSTIRRPTPAASQVRAATLTSCAGLLPRRRRCLPAHKCTQIAAWLALTDALSFACRRETSAPQRAELPR